MFLVVDKYLRPTWWIEDLLIRVMEVEHLITAKWINNKTSISNTTKRMTVMQLWVLAEEWSDWKVIVPKYQVKTQTVLELSNNFHQATMECQLVLVELATLAKLELVASNLQAMAWDLYKAKRVLIDHKQTIWWCHNKSWDPLTWVSQHRTKVLQILRY